MKTMTGVVLLLKTANQQPLQQLLKPPINQQPPPIHTTMKTENNHPIQRLKTIVVLGLLLITSVVPNIVIIKTLLKDVLPVVVMVQPIVKLLTVLPVDQVTVATVSMKFQPNSITHVLLTLV